MELRRARACGLIERQNVDLENELNAKRKVSRKAELKKTNGL